MQNSVLRLDPRDNILIALSDLRKGQQIAFEGSVYDLATDVPAKHKFATTNLAVGDNVIITAQSGTHGDIPAGKMISGSPGFDHRQWMRTVAVYAKLPELARKIRELEAKVEAALASKQENQ